MTNVVWGGLIRKNAQCQLYNLTIASSIDVVLSDLKIKAHVKTKYRIFADRFQ